MTETAGRWANCGVEGPELLTLFQMQTPLEVSCPTAQCHPPDISSGICRWVAGHMHDAHTQCTHGVSTSALSFKRVVFPLGRKQWRTMGYLLCRWAKLCLRWQTVYRYRQTPFFRSIAASGLHVRVCSAAVCVGRDSGCARTWHWCSRRHRHVRSSYTPSKYTPLAGWIMPMQHAKPVQW